MVLIMVLLPPPLADEMPNVPHPPSPHTVMDILSAFAILANSPFSRPIVRPATLNDAHRADARTTMVNDCFNEGRCFLISEADAPAERAF